MQIIFKRAALSTNQHCMCIAEFLFQHNFFKRTTDESTNTSNSQSNSPAVESASPHNPAVVMSTSAPVIGGLPPPATLPLSHQTLPNPAAAATLLQASSTSTVFATSTSASQEGMLPETAY